MRKVPSISGYGEIVRETLRNLECDKGGYEQNFIYNSPYMAILKTVSALIVASFTMMSNTGQ
jgi:hypothetical protein